MKNNQKTDKQLFILISGGKYKGKKILLPQTDKTRPSKSIVRDSIFDSLQIEIRGSTFVELFAGSGSIGFEALSRGAEKIIFFEINKEALYTLHKNRELFLSHEITQNNLEIIAGDSFENLKKLAKNTLSSNYILYIDPPFAIRDGMTNIYNKIELLLKNNNNFNIIILEHMSSYNPNLQLGNLNLIKTKKFGKTSISYYLSNI